MQPWKTLSRQTVLELNPYLVVEIHAVELPDGQIISDWPWVITPDFVNVVALTENNEFLFFRQTKYAITGTSLAPVGGYLEPGEEALAAARRELLEETGYEAATWIELGKFPVDGNRGAGTAHLFLAQGARWVRTIKSDDLEEQELLHLSRSQVEQALAEGQFKLMTWAGIVALALQVIEK